MVGESKQDARGLGGNRAQAAQERRSLPVAPRVVDDVAGPRVGSDRMSAEHHDHRLAALGKQPDQPAKKSLALVVEERLGCPHAARFAGSQNETGGLHWASTAGRFSPANTDSESARQLDGAFRRTAIISAATEIAISSGEMAPRSRPMGA